MPMRIEQKPILAIVLNRHAGDVALRRAVHAGVDVVALAERGADTDGATDVIEVAENEARVGRAVREAVARDLAWVLVPRGIGTAEYVLSAGVRSVGQHVDASHPGIALLVVSTTADPSRSYRRVLCVVDPAGPATSGVSSLASVALAVRTGAALDVVVLGQDDGSLPTSTADWLDLLPVERRTDLLRLAHQRSRDHGVEVRWLASPHTDPVAAVEDQLAREQYDVIADSLGGHRLRKRIGKNQDIRRLIDDQSHAGVLRHALARDGTDVLAVVDGISLGMMPAPSVRAGAATAATAAAAVAVGTVAAAPSAAAAPVVAPSLATSSLTDAGGPISKDEVDAAAGEASQAKSAADDATKAAAAAEKEVAAAERAVEDAQAVMETAREEAEPAAAELDDARVVMAEANADLQDAEAEQDKLRRVAHSYSITAADVLQQERADRAADEVAEAEAAFVEAQSDEAAAYEEYRAFEEDVLAAEKEFDAADAEARAARAEVAAQATKAKELTAEAEDLSAAAAEVRAAWADQGLHPPATGRVTSPFGPRVHPVTGVYKQHTGTDFSGDDGNYYAVADGTVTYAGYDGAYGYMVKVDHGEIGGHHVESWYAHQPGLGVSVGQSVAKGEVIGTIGNSGYSTGPHAHVELHLDGTPVDLMEHVH